MRPRSLTEYALFSCYLCNSSNLRANRTVASSRFALIGDFIESQLFKPVAPLPLALCYPLAQPFERQAAGTRRAPLRSVLFSLVPLCFDIAALFVDRIAQTRHETTVAAQGADGHGR